jgi:hypothetical protein
MSSNARAGAADRLLTEGRYQAQRLEETWRVIDRMTDLPAASNGRDLEELSKEDALEIAAELNRCEAAGSASPLL